MLFLQQTAKQDAHNYRLINKLILLFCYCTGPKTTSNAKLLFATLVGEGGNEKNYPWHIEAQEPHGISTPRFQSNGKAHNER